MKYYRFGGGAGQLIEAFLVLFLSSVVGVFSNFVRLKYFLYDFDDSVWRQSDTWLSEVRRDGGRALRKYPQCLCFILPTVVLSVAMFVVGYGKFKAGPLNWLGSIPETERLAIKFLVVLGLYSNYLVNFNNLLICPVCHVWMTECCLMVKHFKQDWLHDPRQLLRVGVCEEFLSLRARILEIFAQFSLWLIVFFSFVLLTAWWGFTMTVAMINHSDLLFSFWTTLWFCLMMSFCCLMYSAFLLYQLGPVLEMNDVCEQMRLDLDERLKNLVEHCSVAQDPEQQNIGARELSVIMRLNHLMVHKPIFMTLSGIVVTKATLLRIMATFLLTKCLSYLFAI